MANVSPNIMVNAIDAHIQMMIGCRNALNNFGLNDSALDVVDGGLLVAWIDPR